MYEAPVDDYKFVIDHVIGLDQLIATTGHDDISIDLVEAVLSESGKLATDMIAPVIRPGPNATMIPVSVRRLDLSMPMRPWQKAVGPLWKPEKNLVDKICPWF